MNRFLVATGMVALALAATPTLAAVEPAHDAAHAAHPATLQLDHGRKWATDEALRRHMGGLREAVAARPGSGKRAMSPDEARVLGARIEQGVASILTECHLGPEADRNLHVIVSELVQAADVLQGKAAGSPQEATHRAVLALNAYGTHFDHPGWKRAT